MTDKNPTQNARELALEAMKRLAHVEMNISIEEWSSLSNIIINGLQTPAPEWNYNLNEAPDDDTWILLAGIYKDETYIQMGSMQDSKNGNRGVKHRNGPPDVFAWQPFLPPTPKSEKG